MVEKKARHEYYKEALFEKKHFRHRINILCSQGHKIFGHACEQGFNFAL